MSVSMRATVALTGALVLAHGPFASAAEERVQAAPAQASTIAQPRRLAFGEAAELAVRNAPDVQASAQGAAASAERVESARSRRYAGLHVDGNVFVWDKALAFPFPSTDASGMPTTINITVRSKVTSQASVTLA